MFEGLNWAGIIVAAIAAVVVGMVWYSPPLFGKAWGERIKVYAGLTDEDIAPDPPRHIGLWLAGAFINAVVVAILLREVGADSAADGLIWGAGLWLGLGATFSSWPAIFARQPWSVWAINNGAFLGMQLVIGWIVAAWQ